MAETKSRSDTRETAEQIALPLPASDVNYTRERFVVSQSNEGAWRSASAWQQSEQQALVIAGPKGSGKTHLAHLLACERGEFMDWRRATLASVKGDIIVFEGMPPDDPKRFLAVFQDFLNAGKRVVLVGREPISEWSGGLKDLRTRLEATPRASIGLPDEALFRAVLLKTFKDRQLSIKENVVDYIIPRLPRRFPVLFEFVDRADQRAMERKEKISIPLARKVLAAISDILVVTSPTEDGSPD